MTLWTAKEICDATLSSLCSVKGWEATGVAIDSKEVQKGDLFVAIRGAKVDGHTFLKEAFERGAVGALVDHTPLPSDNLIVVRDTREALTDLGRAARNRLTGTVIGITGSAGKTSLKDMVAHMLQGVGKTYATRKSFNSLLTTPLSLASCPKDVDFGVFEVGMNQPGEISKLSRIVRPHIGIITNIAPCHIENLGSLDAIAHEKSQIFAGLPSQGIAILPGDSDHLNILEKTVQAKGIQHMYLFGKNQHCHARLMESTPAGHHRVTILGETLSLSLKMPGTHWALNALTTLLVAKVLGHELKAAAQSLESITPTERRGALISLSERRVLMDESFNANPLSVQMALESMALMPTEGKRIAVLGDMLELGQGAQKFHEGLAPFLKGIDLLLTHGPHMKHLSKKSPIPTKHFDHKDDLIRAARDNFAPHDLMMVKSSNGVGFIDVVKNLRQHFQDKTHAL